MFRRGNKTFRRGEKKKGRSPEEALPAEGSDLPEGPYLHGPEGPYLHGPEGPYPAGANGDDRVDGRVRLDEVYLSGSTRQGPAVVGGLTLVADNSGLTVHGPQPTSVMTMPWGRATGITLRQPATLPDGRGAVALEVGVEGRALRFFVPESGLGPEGIGALRRDLSTLERVPPIVLSPKPATRVVPPPPGPLAPHSQTGPDAPGTGLVEARGDGREGGERAVGDDHAVAGEPRDTLVAPKHSRRPKRGLEGQHVLGASADGTLAGGPIPVGNHHQPTRPRARLKVIAAVLALLAAAGAGVVYVLQVRDGGSGAGNSHDSLVASEVNIEPGELPGWKGVAGTIAGALGASGFRSVGSAASKSLAGSSVPALAVAGFERCSGITQSDADATLTLLGFSEGLAPAASETAEASSPLFEDPSATSTSTSSSVMVFGTSAEEVAEIAVMARPGFGGCYSKFLDSVIPDLNGGATAGIPLAYVAIGSARPTTVTSGVAALSYSEVIVRADHPRGVALYGTVDVFGSGRVIAVVETLSQRPFPASLKARLLTSVEQGVSGDSS
jgi:hypothetical protein